VDLKTDLNGKLTYMDIVRMTTRVTLKEYVRLDKLLSAIGSDNLKDEKYTFEKTLHLYRKFGKTEGKIIDGVKHDFNTVYVKYTRETGGPPGTIAREYGRMYPKLVYSNGREVKKRCCTFSCGMSKLLRDSLCVDDYWDIDQVNSAPSIFVSIADKYKFDVPVTRAYLTNRETVLTDIQKYWKTDRNNAKQLILSVLNGGSVLGWELKNKIKPCKVPESVDKIIVELQTVTQQLLALPENEHYIDHAKRLEKTEKTAFAYLLQQHEHDALMVMYQVAKKNKYTIASLEYDGMKIFRNGVQGPFPKHILLEMQAEVLKQTDLDISIESKPIVGSNKYKSTNCTEPDPDQTPLLACWEELMLYCLDRNLMRLGGLVYKQTTPGIPVYEVARSELDIDMDFSELINDCFESSDNLVFIRKQPSLRKNVIYQCENYRDRRFPQVNINHKLIAFTNGMLQIGSTDTDIDDSEDFDDVPTLSFMNWDEFSVSGNPDVAGVYIKKKFLKSWLNDTPETPLFDKLLSHHIESPDIRLIFKAMIGRLFFKVGELDNWQVMPHILGAANTGKSTVNNVIKSLFPPSQVGTFGKEEIFGLSSIVNKRVVIASDIQQNMDKYIPRSDFQKMVSGEILDVPVKHQLGRTVKWSVPMMTTGNYAIDYEDKAGSISRRIATFKMTRQVTIKDTRMEQKILRFEKPGILIECIKAYINTLKQYSGQAFEDWGIEYFAEARDDHKKQSDPLYNFITAAPGEITWGQNGDTSKYVRYEEGAVCKMQDLAKVFLASIGSKKRTLDETQRNMLQREGYMIDMVKTCKSCGQVGGTSQCCPNYLSKNRSTIRMIHNLVICNFTDTDSTDGDEVPPYLFGIDS